MAEVYRSAGDESGGNGGDTGGDASVIDPAAIDASGAAAPDEQPRKRRGRPPGGGTPSGGTRARAAKKGEKVALDLGAVTGMFVGLHALLAERTGTPELAITLDEGKNFMQSAQNVMRHYSVETTQKTLDWIALMGTAAGIYLPRVAAISVKRSQQGGKPIVFRKPNEKAAEQQGAGFMDIRPDMSYGEAPE